MQIISIYPILLHNDTRMWCTLLISVSYKTPTKMCRTVSLNTKFVSFYGSTVSLLLTFWDHTEAQNSL
jgi:hypothetical protein